MPPHPCAPQGHSRDCAFWGTVLCLEPELSGFPPITGSLAAPRALAVAVFLKQTFQDADSLGNLGKFAFVPNWKKIHEYQNPQQTKIPECHPSFYSCHIAAELTWIKYFYAGSSTIKYTIHDTYYYFLWWDYIHLIKYQQATLPTMDLNQSSLNLIEKIPLNLMSFGSGPISLLNYFFVSWQNWDYIHTPLSLYTEE